MKLNQAMGKKWLFVSIFCLLSLSAQKSYAWGESWTLLGRAVSSVWSRVAGPSAASSSTAASTPEGGEFNESEWVTVTMDHGNGTGIVLYSEWNSNLYVLLVQKS